MMDKLIQEFPSQLMEALDIGDKAIINKSIDPIQNIYVAGMGGSAIGANFTAEFIRGEASLPYNIGKGYDIPAYINENTLFIASTYSGNTEETLSSVKQAIKKNAKIVCITSGGQLLELAKNHNLDYIQVPPGSPSPRACLGYSLVQQLYILYKLDLIEKGLIDNIRSASDLINFDQDEIKNKAEKIAQILHNKMTVVYTTDRMESVAIRFRQQLNENSKVLAWHHVFPEMNHNELVGWKNLHSDIAIVCFRNRDDLKRNAVRIDITKEILMQKAGTFIEIYSKGQSLIEKSIYFVHLGDWVSYFLSQLNGADAIEIEVIDYLKSELAKLN